MPAKGILSWTYQYFLQVYFDSNKRKMALSLRVTEKTLTRALDQENSSESILLFDQLMQYCFSNGISIDLILRKYPKTP